MKTAEALPKTLPGAVVAQYRTVGEKSYGPYWFRVWRHRRKVLKAYVRRSDVEAVRALCEAGRQERKRGIESRLETRRLLSDVSLIFRLMDRADKTPEGKIVRVEDHEWERVQRIKEWGIGK